MKEVTETAYKLVILLLDSTPCKVEMIILKETDNEAIEHANDLYQANQIIGCISTFKNGVCIGVKQEEAIAEDAIGGEWE